MCLFVVEYGSPVNFRLVVMAENHKSAKIKAIKKWKELYQDHDFDDLNLLNSYYCDCDDIVF